MSAFSAAAGPAFEPAWSSAWGAASIYAQALAQLRSRGDTLWLPGVGTINGFTAGNYVESTGITAAVVNDFIGSVLDAGGMRGGELVVNGGFSVGDFTGWTHPDTAPSISIISGGGVLMTAAPGSTLARLRQALTVSAGTYEVTFTASGSTGTHGAILTVGNTANGDVAYASINITADGSYRRILTVIGPTLGLAFTAGSAAGGSVIIDNVSVREISGIRATQPTTANKPQLTRRANLLANTEFTGAVAGSPGTAPALWSFQFSAGSTSIPAEGVTLSAGIGGRHVLAQAIALAPNESYTLSLDVLAVTGSAAENYVHYQVNSGTLTAQTLLTVADGVGRKTATFTAGAAGASVTLRVGPGASAGVASASALTVSKLDIRPTAQISRYQRVTTPTDYDAEGFPYRLSFDGTDSLAATIPAGYESCTIIDATPSGQATLTGQNIVGTYTMGPSITTHGRIISRAALSGAELALYQTLANRLAGL